MLKNRKLWIFLLGLLLVRVGFAQPDSLYWEELFARSATGILQYYPVRDSALQQIVEIGPAVMPFVLNQVETNDAREMHTIWTIARKMGSEATPVLVETLSDSNQIKVIQAAYMLGDSQDSLAFEPLTRLMNHPQAKVRMNAVRGLGKTGVPQAIPFLMYALNDSVPGVRKQAAAAAKHFNVIEIEPLLSLAFTDSSFVVQQGAEIGLQAYLKKQPQRAITLYHQLSKKGQYAFWKIVVGMPQIKITPLIRDAIQQNMDSTLLFLIWQTWWQRDPEAAEKVAQQHLETAPQPIRQLHHYYLNQP